MTLFQARIHEGGINDNLVLLQRKKLKVFVKIYSGIINTSN